MIKDSKPQNDDRLAEISQPQRERLAFIEFRLYFLGEIGRADLMERFDIGPAGATRDFALYKRFAPTNIAFESKNKNYITGESFAPIFKYSSRRVLTMLSDSYGIGADAVSESLLPCVIPSEISNPELRILAKISRAIYGKKPVQLKYCSIESGWSQRVIVPLALADSGFRWHVRAFCRKSQEFRDFVLTRMKSVEIVKNDLIQKNENLSEDIQWCRVIELKMVPHPSHPRPEIVEMDYGMADGSLTVNVRAAVAGYLMQYWKVDCSPDHSEKGNIYPLWLQDPLALYGVRNLVIAPGYKAPKSNTGPEAK